VTFYTDVAQAFAAANRIRRMRPLKEPDCGESLFIIGDSEEGEKESQGVKIELRNIWFKYPTRDISVLKGLSMTVSLNTSF